MATLLLGVGLVLAIEGLVFALAPSRLEDVLEALRQMPIEIRRLIGLASLTGGVILISLAKFLGS